MADTVRIKSDLVNIFADNTTGQISPQTLRDLIVSTLSGDDTTSFNMRGRQLISPIFHNASGDPATPASGQLYFNTFNQHFFGWNGSGWKQLDN